MTRNPYINALRNIAGVGLGVGGLIAIVSFFATVSASRSYDIAGAAAAAGWLGLGAGLLSLGLLFLAFWLHAAALTHPATTALAQTDERATTAAQGQPRTGRIPEAGHWLDMKAAPTPPAE